MLFEHCKHEYLANQITVSCDVVTSSAAGKECYVYSGTLLITNIVTISPTPFYHAINSIPTLSYCAINSTHIIITIAHEQ